MAPSFRSCVRFLAAAGLMALMSPGMALAQIYFDTHEDSRIWLEGSSTVHRFDCVARSIQGAAFIEGYSGETPATADTQEGQDGKPGLERRNLHVLLKIPVRSFDCRHSRMNRDMYEALKSDKYEFITFEFEDAEVLDDDGTVPGALFNDGYQPFRIQGVLNVAGVDRKVALVVQGRTEGDDRYHIKGQKEISMQDFEIDPPTALRGLIRAHDDLTVFFDLLVVETSRD